MQQMIDDIEVEVDYTAKMIGRHSLSDRVMEAMRQVPRHAFVDPSQLDEAYDNRPLPIGYGQTISQPYMVAVMTDLLEPRPHHRILEIGCGGFVSVSDQEPKSPRAHRRGMISHDQVAFGQKGIF